MYTQAKTNKTMQVIGIAIINESHWKLLLGYAEFKVKKASVATIQTMHVESNGINKAFIFLTGCLTFLLGVIRSFTVTP